MQHTITQHIVKAASVVVTVGTAMSLIACSSADPGASGPDPACAAMPDYTVPAGAQSVVALLDATGSMRDGGWLAPALGSIIERAAGVYSTLSVLWVGGDGETPVWAIDDLPLNHEGYEFDTKHFNEQVDRVTGCVAAMIGQPVNTAPGTDLGTAIQVGADRLAEATGPKQLIVVSDGLSNSGPISLTGAIATTAVDAVVARLDHAGYRPDLEGVDATFLGLGVTAGVVTNGPSVTWLRNYYTAVCERAGALHCDTPIADQGASGTGTAARVDAPEDPDLVLPTVQFEFNEAEVRFEPESAVISPEADAALSRAAACLQDGSTLTVIGHSAYVGDPAGEQATSEERAQAVAARILALAGEPAVTVVAFGVGATEPKSDSGQEPEDRRVEVSLTGTCDR